VGDADYFERDKAGHAVRHMVFPHAGNGPRISIAFNLRDEPYP